MTAPLSLSKTTPGAVEDLFKEHDRLIEEQVNATGSLDGRLATIQTIHSQLDAIRTQRNLDRMGSTEIVPSLGRPIFEGTRQNYITAKTKTETTFQEAIEKLTAQLKTIRPEPAPQKTDPVVDYKAAMKEGHLRRQRSVKPTVIPGAGLPPLEEPTPTETPQTPKRLPELPAIPKAPRRGCSRKCAVITTMIASGLAGLGYVYRNAVVEAVKNPSQALADLRNLATQGYEMLPAMPENVKDMASQGTAFVLDKLSTAVQPALNHPYIAGSIAAALLGFAYLGRRNAQAQIPAEKLKGQ